MKTLLTLILLSISFVTLADDGLIPYKILQKEAVSNIKVVFDVEVPLINKRLPNEEELGKLSNYLVSKEPPRERFFVTFYLPHMKRNAGAFATAHHDPKMKVEILKYMLIQYPEYKKFAKE